MESKVGLISLVLGSARGMREGKRLHPRDFLNDSERVNRYRINSPKIAPERPKMVRKKDGSVKKNLKRVVVGVKKSHSIV